MDKRTPAEVPARKKRRPASRRLVQLWAALLHNAYLRGFIEGKIYEGNAKALCVPGLNCYSCPGAAGSCPLGALQNALAASGHRAGWYVLGILLLFGITLGRTVCGWLCPMGLIQELLHKIPVPKLPKGRATRVLSLLKYVILAVFVIALPLYFGLARDLPLPAFCKYICPAGTLEGAVGHLVHPDNASMFGMLGGLFTGKWVILTAVGLLCVFCFRGFCRFVCPLGALYGLFSRFSAVGVRVDPDRCVGCGACVRNCGMDVRHVGDRECIQCGACMDRCARGAISVRAGRITLCGPELPGGGQTARPAKRLRAAMRILALAVLCFALVWFNFLDPSVRDREAPAPQPAAASAADLQSTAPVGSAVGERPADFTLPCYDGSEFRLADTRGRVTVINRWATWCAPCIAELPYFEALYRAHPDDLAVLILHPNMTVTDPEAFLADLGITLPCATDGEGDPVEKILGGGPTLPQTVVLNRRGEVVYNGTGSVNPEMLEALFEEAARP